MQLQTGKEAKTVRKSPGQKLVLALPSCLSPVVPMVLRLLVDRCLGFVRNISSDFFAGKSYNMKCRVSRSMLI